MATQTILHNDCVSMPCAQTPPASPPVQIAAVADVAAVAHVAAVFALNTAA